MNEILTMQNITIFVLAILVGYHIVWNVTSALHTPLMSVTNAISGVVIVGAMLQTVQIDGEALNLTSILGAIAIFLASINIFGGFMVTHRMLAMFKKKDKKEAVKAEVVK
ncbi:MAG: pyridine nucleotide transhydrogenase [Methylophilaceae bacterium]|nr:MAG: pyridine nucleotide transhydrogenase [Methylophilaceae bacterium]